MSPTLLQGPEHAPESGNVKRLVIFLHGLGADGNDLISLADMIDLPDTQYVSPNAPFACDMAPYGYQWFSLLDRTPARMLAGIHIAAPMLNHYIDHQLARFKLTPKDVALVGFSQGAMMSLYTAPRRAEAIAGIVAFSGAMVGAETFDTEMKSKPPVCIIHGEQDEVVPFAAMGLAEKALRTQHVSVETHARPMLGHGIDPEGLDVATQFLRRCFTL